VAKILVVDDDYAFAEFAKTLLASLGHQAVICPGGKTAKAMTLAEKPEFVLLDLMMPEVDGIDVLRQLKGDAATKDIPVVICSVVNAPHKVEEALSAGAADFLRKPLSRTALAKALGNAGLTSPA